MAVFPQKPRTGEKVLQGLYNSVCQIIDYLPSLEVRGDFSSTSVTKTSNGTIIHASNNNSNLSQGRKYYGFHGISLEYDPYIGCTLSGGRFITVDYYEQNEQGEEVELDSPLINCTLSGGRFIEITDAGLINYTGPSGSGGTGSGYVYIGDGDIGSGHIFVDYATSGNPVICSNLVHIDDLLNYNISANNHFLQNRHLKDGAGTVIRPHYNSTGAHDQEDGDLISYMDGLEVDLNVSGGQYIRSIFYNGLGYDGDNDIASIDCLLSGSNFIKIVPVQESDGLTGGIISTNLHAGSGIFIDPDTGEIRCTVNPSPGPGPGPGGGPEYEGGRFIEIGELNQSTNKYPINCILSAASGIIIDGNNIALTGYFYNDLLKIHQHRINTNKVLSTNSEGELFWAENIAPTPPTPQNYYYADNDTLSTTISGGNIFYARDVQKLLEGRGGTYVGHLSSDESGHEITLISSANVPTKLSELDNDEGFITASDIPPGNIYYAGSGLALSSDNKTFYLTAHIPLSTSELINDVPFATTGWVDDNFISGGATGDHMYYNSKEKRLKCMLTGGTNIEIEDIGDYGYINCTLTGLDQLANTPGYITEAQIPPGGKEYEATFGLATSGADNNVFYLTGTVLSGGRLIDINSNNIDFKLSAGKNINFNEDKINCQLTGLDQLENTPGYITISQVPPGSVYSTGFGLAASGEGSNIFYLTGTVLSGGRFVEINSNEINWELSAGNNINFNDNKINCELTGLDQLTNTPGFITSAQVPSSNVYGTGFGLAASGDNNSIFYLTGSVLSGGTNIEIKDNWVSNLLSGGRYVDVNNTTHLIDWNLSTGTNINFNGNKINCQLTGLDQLENTPGFITINQVPPGSVYSTGFGLAASGEGSNVFYLTGTVLSGDENITRISNNVIQLIPSQSEKTQVLKSYDGSISWGDQSTNLKNGRYISIDEDGKINLVLSAGTNINFNGNKINCQLTDLNQLTNSPGFITSAQVPSSNVYGAGFGLTLSTGNIFQLTGSILNSGSYVSINNNQIDFTLSAGKNINYTDNKINCSLTGLDQLTNTPGFITQAQIPPGSVYKAGDGLALSSDNQTFYLTGTVLSGGDFIDINSNNIDFELSAGTNINFNGNKINCQITGLNQLDNATTNYITQADIPPSTTYIGTSGVEIETILDANLNPTTSANVFLNVDFYNTLTGINDHSANKVLSTNASNQIVWATNTGGSSPTPTPGGNGENIVYITAEGEYDLVANTHYFVLLDPVLSGNQNYTAEDQQWYKIYKYMWYDKDTGENQGQTILTTTVRYEDEYYNYGAYKTPGDPDSWMDYNEGGVFGAILKFPVPQAATHITITAFRNSNSIVCAPYGGIIWDWSNPQYYPISGTTGLWFGQFLQRMDKDFIYDPSTQRWYVNGN